MASYGPLFQTVRMLLRPFFPLKSIPEIEALPRGAVYVCRHRNMRGPLYTLLHLKIQPRPWVLSVFCEREECFEQFGGYTLSVRLRWKPLFARTVARILSWIVPAAVRSAGGIPVYRHSTKIATTFRQSLKALEAGQSIILYADVEYTDMTDEVGELYDGFLLLGRMYYAATGKQLLFVPVDYLPRERKIAVGEPVIFQGNAPYEEEKSRVSALLDERIQALGRE